MMRVLRPCTVRTGSPIVRLGLLGVWLLCFVLFLVANLLEFEN